MFWVKNTHVLHTKTGYMNVFTLSIIQKNPLFKCTFYHLTSVLYMRTWNKFVLTLWRQKTQKELVHITLHHLQVQSYPFKVSNKCKIMQLTGFLPMYLSSETCPTHIWMFLLQSRKRDLSHPDRLCASTCKIYLQNSVNVTLVAASIE
jgi:hypothetical protein